MIKIRNIIPFYSIILLFLALNGGCKDSSVVNNFDDPACNIDKDMLQTADSSYSGAEICKGCHGAIYSDWAASGHAFKINPVKNGIAPV